MNSKQTPEKLAEILDLVRQEYPTKEELCRRVGIDCKTLAAWRKKNPDFEAQMEKAKHQFLIKTASGPALSSLIKCIQGYYVEEEKTTYIRDKFTHKEKVFGRVVTRRYIQPNTALLIFVMSNLWPEEFEK